jgi:hypothetical protein
VCLRLGHSSGHRTSIGAMGRGLLGVDDRMNEGVGALEQLLAAQVVG